MPTNNATNGSTKKSNAGRKTKYDPKTFPKRARHLAEQGALDTEIAKNLGVSVTTLNEYKNKYPEFLLSVKEGKVEHGVATH